MAIVPRFLRTLLTAAVIGPAAAVIGLLVYSVHGTNGWDHDIDKPGFALCGMFVIASIAVLVIWLAARTFARRDGEGHAEIAYGCGLGFVMLSISLGDAAAVGLGLKDGRVPLGMLLGVISAWVYLAVVGLGHWHLSRLLSWSPAPRTELLERKNL